MFTEWQKTQVFPNVDKCPYYVFMTQTLTFQMPAASDVSLRTFAHEAHRLGLAFEHRTPADLTDVDTTPGQCPGGFDVAGATEALNEFTRTAVGLGARS